VAAPQNLLEQATSLFANRVQDYARGMAQYLGSPLSGVQLSQDEAVQRWNYTPLASTDAADQQYYDLLQQGMQPGQALDQVYPMRKQLMSGPDLQSVIDKARQLAGWSADTTGQSPPAPYDQSTLPLLQQQQRPPPPPISIPNLMSGLNQAPVPTPAPGMLQGVQAAPSVPPPVAAQPPPAVNPQTLPPPATTAPPNAEAPLGGGMLPSGTGPTGNLQA
jgi:hypothetical protein